MAEKSIVIQAQVPGEQKLRRTNNEISEPNSTVNASDKVEIYTDSDSYSPVIKITKHEETFTKGDLKLQRVSNIHGYSPRVQRMRKIHKNEPSSRGSDDGKDLKIKNEGHPTKIPGLRVRQVVEKLRVKDMPSDKSSRRSSIPKLIPRNRSRTTSVDSNKGTYRICRRRERPSIDDTFERIYIEAAVDIDKVDDELDKIVPDIEDVDSKFEIVANAYETIEDPPIEKKQSKIPIKRFISHHEKTKLQNIDRRHTVHTNVVNNNIKKLSKKKINNIENLDALLNEADKKAKEPTLLIEIENNVQNKTNNIADDFYDDMTVTLLPNKIDTNTPNTNLDRKVSHDLYHEQIKSTFDKESSDQQDTSTEYEESGYETKGLEESYYSIEYNGDFLSTKTEGTNKPINNEDILFHYENVEITPVLSKIALFEERSSTSPKLRLPITPVVDKSMEFLEVAVTKKEDVPDYEPILKIDEPVTIEENKTSKSKPVITNVRESITIEPKTKVTEDIHTDKIKSKSHDPIKKSKSSPDLDSGGALSYQKQRKYSRMSSVEKLVQKIERNSKYYLIDFKERPRKQSVSEKIALFEGKSQPNNEQVSNKMVESIKYKLLNFANNTERNQVKDEVDVSKKTDPYAEKIEELKSAKSRYGTMKDVKYIELNNGIQMPVIALGTALLDPALTFHVITAAIDLGYRAFDTAYIDGNEREIGEAIKCKIEDGTVTREDLFIINKLWSTFHRTDLVEQACKNSLEVMQLEYFDLYLIHNPMSFKEGPNPIPKIANVLQYSVSDYLDAWYGMEMLVQEGLVRSIGVSNFNSVQLARVIEKGRIPPVVNQVESHPYLTQVRLQEFCSTYNVVVQSYGVLGSTNHVLVDTLVRICAAGMNAEPAQTLIRFQLDMERAVVVKASTGQHLWSNLQSTEIKVNSTELRALHALNTNRRLFNYKGLGDTHRNYPFNIPF